jgi:hypothetical protein
MDDHYVVRVVNNLDLVGGSNGERGDHYEEVQRRCCPVGGHDDLLLDRNPLLRGGDHPDFSRQRGRNAELQKLVAPPSHERVHQHERDAPSTFDMSVKERTLEAIFFPVGDLAPEGGAPGEGRRDLLQLPQPVIPEDLLD